METFLKRFTEMINELERHPKVVVLNFQSFPPVSELQIQKVEASLGFTVDASIKLFYRQTNGLQLRWITTENEDFDDTQHKPQAGALDWLFARKAYRTEDGLIMIQPIEFALLENWHNVVYFDWMKGKEENFMNQKIDLLEFSKNIRPFDLFTQDQDMAFYLNAGQPTPVLWGDDHHACYTRSRVTDFGSYLEFLLAHKGLISSRASFFRKEEGHKLPLLQTPQSHWTKVNSLNLQGYLLEKVFPLAGQAGADTSNLNASLMAMLSQSADPLSPEIFETICKKHRDFLMSGGGGGCWESLAVSGMVLGLYKGPKGSKGAQASFERQHLPSEISLKEIGLPFANFCSCYAPGVNFSGADLACCLFTDSILENTIFTAAQLAGSDFSRANLYKADFRNADLRSCDFENCDLRGANFIGAKLAGARFPGACLEGVRYQV